MSEQYRLLYFLTAVSFSCVNFLNVTYSFVKRFIEAEFNMNSTEIGVADALKFLGNIIGLIIYISFGSVPKSKVCYIYSLSIVLNGFIMGVIPLSSIFGWNDKWIVFLFNFFGGMAKAPSWPLLLQLVKDTIFRPYQEKENEVSLNESEMRQNQEVTQKFSSKQNGKKFIVWTSLTLLGNIFGLVVSQILIYKVKLAWNLCLLIPICSIVFFALMMSLYSFFNEISFDSKDDFSKQTQQNVQSSTNTYEMVVKCLKLLFLTKNSTFIWSLVLLLSIHSIMMMFLPLFLFKIGYHEYEGYILAWYNIWVILGTFGFTCINFDTIFKYQFLIMPKTQLELSLEEESRNYEIRQSVQIQQQAASSSPLETVNFVSLFLLLAACIILVTLPCPYNCGEVSINGEINLETLNHDYKVFWYFFVLGLVGLFLGGPLNKYESFQLIEVLKLYEESLNQRKFDQFQKHTKLFYPSPSPKKGFKTFIGIIQLLSYFTVIFFLILTGHIIETDILGFFYLISILAAFLLILDIIKILQRQLQN